MARSVEKRIEVLEKLYGTDTRADRPEGWREKMAASLKRPDGAWRLGPKPSRVRARRRLKKQETLESEHRGEPRTGERR
jgi:hypothetical protein